jgi:rod shape-determining protein MreD
MRYLKCCLVAFILLLVQSALHHFGLPEWFVPQGVLVCVVFLAFYEFSLVGVVLAFLLGLLLDLSSGVLLGPWAGAYVIVYAMFAFLSQRLFVESVVVAMSVVALATVLAGTVFLLLAFEYQAVTREDMVMLGGQAVASALVAPFVFRVLSRAWRCAHVAVPGRASVVSAV